MFLKLLAVVLFAGSAYGWGFDPRQAGRNGYDSYGRYTGTSTYNRNWYGNQWQTTSNYYDPYRQVTSSVYRPPPSMAAPSRFWQQQVTSQYGYMGPYGPYGPNGAPINGGFQPFTQRYRPITSQYGYMGPYGPYGPNGAPINGGYRPITSRYNVLAPRSTRAAPSRIIDRMTSYSTYIAVQGVQIGYRPFTTRAVQGPITSQYGYMGPYGPYGPNGAPINGGFRPFNGGLLVTSQYGYVGPYGPYGPNGPINGGFQPGRYSRVFYTVSRPAGYSTNIFAGIPSSLAPFPISVIPPPLDARGTKCGGTYKVGKGATFIKSPNFPNHYPRLETCVYKFTAPKGKRVKITFTSMNVEMHKRCVWDSIAVINGGPKGQQVAKICGNTNRGFTLKGRAGTLIFRTDGSVQKNGWRAKLTAV